MSQAKEDWKYFDQVSDTICIRDLTSPQSIEVHNVSKGQMGGVLHLQRHQLLLKA